MRKHLTFPDYLLAVCFGATIIIVSLQVLFRYVFNNSLTWSEELARYLFTWMTFLGTACAFRDSAHIRLEALVNRFPNAVKRRLRFCMHVLLILFLELVIILGFQLIRHTAGTQSPALSLPVNIVYYSSLPVAFLLALFYEIRSLLRMTGLIISAPDDNTRSGGAEC